MTSIMSAVPIIRKPSHLVDVTQVKMSKAHTGNALRLSMVLDVAYDMRQGDNNIIREATNTLRLADDSHDNCDMNAASRQSAP